MHNHYGIRGFYSWEIVDGSSGIIEKKSLPKNNLILNQGLDYIASRSFSENFTSCAISSFYAPPLLTDTGLTDEFERTNNYQSSSTAMGTSLIGNTLSLTRVFDFSIATVATYIGTIGWSYTNTPGDNLFSKSLMIDENGNPGQILLLPGKFLRVTYTLQITLSPGSPNIGSAQIAGWSNTNGQNQIQYIGLKKVDSNGSVSDYDAGGSVNEPSNTSSAIFVSTNSAALAALGSNVVRAPLASSTTITSSYANGSYVINKTASFGRGVAVSSSIRSMGIGVLGSAGTNSTFVHVFDSAQTKESAFELGLGFSYSWNRV